MLRRPWLWGGNKQSKSDDVNLIPERITKKMIIGILLRLCLFLSMLFLLCIVVDFEDVLRQISKLSGRSPRRFILFLCASFCTIGIMWVWGGIKFFGLKFNIWIELLSYFIFLLLLFGILYVLLKTAYFF